MDSIYKYPRTRHIEGSGIQAGDDDLQVARWSELAGKHLVVEEKMDGANCGVSFDTDYSLLLQSRGHYLTGGPREKQFDLLKQWETDLRLLMVASEENMSGEASGNTADQLSAVRNCLQAMGASGEERQQAPNKSGGA